LRDALAAHLQPLDLGRPHEELRQFFAGPSAYRKALVPRLLERVLGRAERLLQEGRPAKALSCLNHALALEPGSARARVLLEAMDQARRRQRRASLLRRGVAGGALLAAAVGIFASLDLSAPPPLPEVRLPAPEPPPEPRAELSLSPAPSPAPEPAGVPRPAAAKVPVSIQVRPWAYLQVDGGPRSPEPLAEHRLQLTPGPHRVKITCPVCEPSTEAIDVPDGPSEEPFRLAARPRPALLVFEVDPPEATVRVGGEERPARDTAAAPFQVAIPRGSFQSPVEYTVRSPGFQTLTGQVMAKAGERAPVAVKLVSP